MSIGSWLYLAVAAEIAIVAKWAAGVDVPITSALSLQGGRRWYTLLTAITVVFGFYPFLDFMLWSGPTVCAPSHFRFPVRMHIERYFTSTPPLRFRPFIFADRTYTVVDVKHYKMLLFAIPAF